MIVIRRLSNRSRERAPSDHIVNNAMQPFAVQLLVIHAREGWDPDHLRREVEAEFAAARRKGSR